MLGSVDAKYEEVRSRSVGCKLRVKFVLDIGGCNGRGFGEGEHSW